MPLVGCLWGPAQRIQEGYRDRLGKSEKPSRFALKKFFPASFLQADFFVGNVEYRSGIYAFSPTKSAQTC